MFKDTDLQKNVLSEKELYDEINQYHIQQKLKRDNLLRLLQENGQNMSHQQKQNYIIKITRLFLQIYLDSNLLEQATQQYLITNTDLNLTIFSLTKNALLKFMMKDFTQSKIPVYQNPSQFMYVQNYSENYTKNRNQKIFNTYKKAYKLTEKQYMPHMLKLIKQFKQQHKQQQYADLQAQQFFQKALVYDLKKQVEKRKK